jgi:hypothetical protein
MYSSPSIENHQPHYSKEREKIGSLAINFQREQQQENFILHFINLRLPPEVLIRLLHL